MDVMHAKVANVLTKAKKSGISVFVDDEKLKIKIEKNKTVDNELLDLLRTNKDVILNFLKSNEGDLYKINGSYDEIKPFDRTTNTKIPLSFSQERLWFIDQLQGTKNYHITSVFRMKGALDRDALEYAIKTLISRHEILRTVIKQEDGVAYQHIKDNEAWSMEFVEFDGDDADLGSLTKDYIYRPFDLSADYMIRVRLMQLSPVEYLLIVVVHHIAADGWSMSIMVNELVELYESRVNGRAATLPTLPIQYLDYAAWQRQYLQQGGKDHLAYWEKQLSGTTPLELPKDYARPLVQSTLPAGKVELNIDKEISNALSDLSRQEQATLFMTLITVFKILLYRYTGQEDICVGIPIANRTQREVEPLIGFFVNTLVLRGDLSEGPSFKELLQRIKAMVLEAYAHQQVPFDKVVERVAPERKLSGSPLFQVAFLLQNMPAVPDLKLGDVSLQAEGFENGPAKYDLTFELTEGPSGISINVEYNVDLFASATVERMVAHYKALLTSVVQNPNQQIGKLAMLSAIEEHQILVEFNNTSLQFPERGENTILDLFEEQVKNSPDSVALIFDKIQLTYKQLDERSNQLAHYLRRLGVKEETLVPICIERGMEMIVAALGIMKAGGAYVPIDPEYPEDRIRFMLEDTKAEIVVSSNISKSKIQVKASATLVALDASWELIKNESKENLKLLLYSDALAYVIYTSGSTGKPKGVAIEHSGLFNLVQSQGDILNLRPGMSTLQFASFSFDASCSEIFTVLSSGGVLVIPRKEDLLSGDSLIGLIDRYKIDVVTLPPSYQLLIKESLGNLHTIISAGEPLIGSLAKELQSQGIRIFNAYGPTENTVCITMTDNPVLSAGTVTIGKPINNVSVYIVDKNLNLVPVGVPGELWVGGAQVAREYLNRPELTEQKFIEDPFSNEVGARVYKTGDLARWLPDGNIEYLGRIDNQIKVAGHRIECGEIEALLIEHTSVEDAVVVVNEKQEVGKLVAFYKEKNKVELWPSIAEFFIYDDIVYRSMYEHINRNNKYKEALQKVIVGKTVLEIGPGPEAVLSRLCLDCGAKHVYAVEILEETYLKAKKCIESLGLTDKITLIHGDIQHVTLNEKVDYCVSEIVGSIAGSEGSAVLIDVAKKFLHDPSKMIPSRSITKIAAITLDESSFDYGFSDIANHYVERIEENFGAGFEFRICLKNFPQQNIISSDGVFEDLDYSGELKYELSHEIELRISKDSVFNGFYVWMDLFLDDDIHLDIAEDPASWLPIYFPISYPGYPVQKGDCIKARITRKLSSNGINPDYFIEGSLIDSEGRIATFSFESYHHLNKPSENVFYKKLFKSEKTPLTKPDSTQFRQYLSKYLPDYMIPSAFIPLESIPLTPNGKVDRKELSKRDFDFQGVKGYTAPRTTIEKKLVDVWQQLLGVKQVGIHDNFFELGGDSIITIQMISRAKRLGLQLQPRDLFQHQTIATLATCIKEQVEIQAEQGILSGPSPLLPIQKWFFDQRYEDSSHFNQTILLEIDKTITLENLSMAMAAIVDQHDALRFFYTQQGDAWTQSYGGHKSQVVVCDLQNAAPDQFSKEVEEVCDIHQRTLSIEKGDLIRSVFIKTPSWCQCNRLLLAVHHLAVDGVSWRIIIEDLENYLTSIFNQEPLSLGSKTSSYREWAEALKSYTQSEHIESQLPYWKSVVDEYVPLPVDKHGNKLSAGATQTYSFELETAMTEALTTKIHSAYKTEITDILLGALTQTIAMWSGQHNVVIGLEGHGREDFSEALDVTRTVGWFTTVYPVLLLAQPSYRELIQSVKKQITKIPDKGIGYGLLRYLHPNDEVRRKLSAPNQWDVVFNYLGQLDNITSSSRWFAAASESVGASQGENNGIGSKLEINCSIAKGQLSFILRYRDDQYTSETIKSIAGQYIENIRGLIYHCLDTEPVTEYSNDAKSLIQHKHAILLEAGESGLPIFIAPGMIGISQNYQELAQALSNRYPVYGLQMQGVLEGEIPLKDMEAVAGQSIRYIKEVQPHGPYKIVGHSFGSFVTYEMVKQLESQGEEVEMAVVLDTEPICEIGDDKIIRDRILFYVEKFLERINVDKKMPKDWKQQIRTDLPVTSFDQFWKYIRNVVESNGIDYEGIKPFKRLFNMLFTNMHLRYRPDGRINQKLIVVKAEQSDFSKFEPDLGWGQYANVDVITVPGDHLSMVEGENVKVLVNELRNIVPVLQEELLTK